MIINNDDQKIIHIKIKMMQNSKTMITTMMNKMKTRTKLI